MTDAYAKSKGVLFINSTPNDKAPNFKGNILVTKEQVASLIDFLKKGEEAKLQIAGWHKTSQSGKDYINYYRKWCAGFAKYCGLTPEEMHEEILMITFGEKIVETKLGQKRRPLNRSQGTSKQTYSDLIDNLIRKAAEMGYEVPISKVYQNPLQAAKEKWGMK